MVPLVLVLGPGAPEPGALSLDEALERVEETIEVQRARVAYETALRDVEIAAMRSDPSLTLSPGVRADGYDDRSDVDRWAATFNVNATVPLGLSEDQRIRLERGRDAAEVARSNLQQTRADQTLRIVRLYHDAWLGGKEITVLEEEVAVQRELARIERLRFEQGEISWDALLRADAEYRGLQADLSDVTAAHRSAMIALALAVGLAPEQLHPLEDPAGVAVPGLAASVIIDGHDSANNTGNTEFGTNHARSSAVVIQERILGGALRDAARSPSVLSQATIRAGADLGDHSSTLSYSILAPSIGMSYSPAPFVFSESSESENGSGGSSGGSRDYDWTISLGVSLSFSGTRTEQVEQERLSLAVDREQAILAHLLAQDEARLDATRARVARAERNLVDAQATLERTEVALEIVETRSRTGQVRPVELDQARVARNRSEFDVERARLALEAARMELTSAGDYR